MRLVAAFVTALFCVAASPPVAPAAQPAPVVRPAAPALPLWNPRAPENNQRLPAFTVATVTPVLRAIGARFQRLEGNALALLVTFRNGRVAQLTFSSCEAEARCKALSLQSFWKLDPAIAADKKAEAIEKFNHHYAFAKAFVTPDGRPSLQRYLTADYGFIRGDLAVNLLTFSDQAERMTAEFLEPLAKTK